MKFWPRRSRLEPPAPRPDPTRIAILEHDLFGIQPQPGTAAALAIGLRRVGACSTHAPVEVTGLGDQTRNGLCTRCGIPVILNDEGDWAAV
ncbi:hypothetical protein ACL07V_37230 [Streptomyces sp. MB22_4]|uniref:hypothetical protein n=1 Tax=Streptomyces sp. MB22_4 TaxID=3383120 RepID=UPI0039A34889